TDPLGDTILIVEAANAVPWPKPEELDFDSAKPLPKLGGQFADGFYAAFADGQVRFIKKDTDEKLLRAWITRSGGAKVELPPAVDVAALVNAAGFKDAGFGTRTGPTTGPTTGLGEKQSKEKVPADKGDSGVPRTGKSELSKDEAKARLKTVIELRQLALALNDFHDAMRGFPPAAGEEHAKVSKLKGMSWRAHVLPFIEGRRDIYDGLLQDKYPSAKGAADLWNRPGLLNISLFREPNEFRPKPKEPWLTHYRVFVGKGAAFEKDKKLSIKDFSDGDSNTILVVEALEAVPWPKPEELEYDPSKPLSKLGGQFEDGFYAAFADASVHFLPKTINEKTLRALITR